MVLQYVLIDVLQFYIFLNVSALLNDLKNFSEQYKCSIQYPFSDFCSSGAVSHY